MRIVIDLQGAQSASRFRGIGRYTLSHALAIARNANEHEIWLVLNGAFPETIFSIRHFFAGYIPEERIRIFSVPVPVIAADASNIWRIRAAEMLREHFLQQLKPDVVYVSSLFEGYLDNVVTSIGSFTSKLLTAVTLYDLIPLMNQQDYLPNEIQQNYYMRKVQSLKRADLLLAISDASRIEAIGILKMPSSKFVTISAATDEKFKHIVLTEERISHLRVKFNLERSMVMYAPGGFDQRKNIDGLITAYAMLSPLIRSTHQLVIVGNVDADKINELQKMAYIAGLSKDEFIMTGYVSDQELVELYNLATLFVFPSKHEGFGLPVLEAMACGTPVIGSCNTSIPEIISLPGALFDPFSPHDICNKITKVLLDKSFRETLSIHGLNRVKSYSWDDCAKTTIKSLEMLLQSSDATLVRQGVVEGIPKLIQSISAINETCKPTAYDLIRVAESLAYNARSTEHKQLLLDISVIVFEDSKTGIQRVVRSLLRELIGRPPYDTRVRPIYFDGEHYRYANQYIETFTGKSSVDRSDEIIDFCQDDIYLSLDLIAHLTEKVHGYHLHLQSMGVKIYYVVYDILFTKRPDWCSDGASYLLEKWLRSISEVATGLICISEAVASDVRAWLLIHFPSRLSVPMISSFHLGADIENSLPTKGIPDQAAVINNLLKDGVSFLSVGTIEPRKGYTQTLAALESLWAEGVDVKWIIVGGKGWNVDSLTEKLHRHGELGKRLIWLESLSDEYLEVLYQSCSCLLATSEGEGFGLPLIEAAQHRLPIIARDIPVFREVASVNAFFFSGNEPLDLANALKRWLVLFSQGIYPRSENITYLSWRESAEQLCQQIKLIPGLCNSRNQLRQLFVDISELVHRDAKTGVQRVTRSILSELLDKPPTGFETKPVYAAVGHGYRYARQFISKFLEFSELDLTDFPIEYQAGDIFLGLDLQLQIIPAQQELFTRLQKNGVKVYYFVHDLLPIKLPKAFPVGTYEAFVKWLEVISRGDGAICVSKSTADDLRSWLSNKCNTCFNNYKITWSHNGADIINSKPSAGLPENASKLLEVMKLRPSFLMVGTLEPRKGYTQILDAFEQLWSQDYDINYVVVGKEGWMVNELIKRLNKHKELGKRLFWLDGISDEFLQKIYEAASCLIAASEDEGFGLPLIEAAQYNVPIIARDIPVFREVAGSHAFYFSGIKPSDFVKCIKTWLNLYRFNSHPSSIGMKRITWRESTENLVAKIMAMDN